MSERLLYALSSRGSFKLDEFYDILSREWNVTDGDERAVQTDKRLECTRFFEALCFAEVDWTQRKIYASPTGWALLPKPGLPAAVLVGGRSPSLLREIRKRSRSSAKNISLHEEARHWMDGAFPSLVLATGSSMDALAEFCAPEGGFNIGEPAAWAISKAGLSLDAVVATMKFTIHGEPNWRRAFFDVEKMRFLPDGKPCGESRFSAYTDPKTQQRLHVIWKDRDGAIISRDWGRYHAFREAGRQVLFYNGVKKAMAIPATAPLPPLLLRAAAMCSARVPVRTFLPMELRGMKLEMPYNVLLFIPEAVAGMVAKKAGQELVSWDMPGVNGSDYVRY